MTMVYQHLSWQCWREHISAKNPKMEEEPSPVTSEVRNFLLQEPWIFLPTQRRGEADVWEEVPGTFLPLKAAAFTDKTGLFSDRPRLDSCYDGLISDEMLSIVSQRVCLRTVAEHYKDKDVRRFFEAWGVTHAIGWDVYLSVLRMVDELVREREPDHVWNQDRTLYKIVWCIVMMLGKTRFDEDAAEDDIDQEGRQ